jgi:hypothetical protein
VPAAPNAGPLPSTSLAGGQTNPLAMASASGPLPAPSAVGLGPTAAVPVGGHVDPAAADNLFTSIGADGLANGGNGRVVV